MASALVYAAAAIVAQSPADAAPCSAPEYRQLDFWVGDWALEFDRGEGRKGTASNRITRDDFGACATVERFEMPSGYKGGSYSMYDRDKKQWRQMWVDNNGGTFTLVGGPVSGEDHIFELRTLEPTGRDRLLRRMIWQDVAPDSLKWRWQSKQPDGSWKDEWVLDYRREQP